MLRRVRRELIFKTVAWAASSSSKWATTLNHEIRNHTVEIQTIIEWRCGFFTSFWISPSFCAFSKTYEISYSFWSCLVEELNFEITFVCFEDCEHIFISYLTILMCLITTGTTGRSESVFTLEIE
ncbi:hypothetical protein D3C87_1729370 [compost metagenome]